MSTLAKPKILIVDDSSDNLQILMQILQSDYAVIAAMNGKKALQLAAKEPIPDLIILDVVMPELDGYEVCAQLKANPQTESIPVIFITALTEVGNETRGFELGAVDYMTKPFNPAIVKARIKSHLTLQHLHQELQQKNADLARVTYLKDEFLANMSHELRTPLNAILGMSEALQEQVLGSLNERQNNAIAIVEKSGRHLLELINDILDLSKISSGKVELVLTSVSVQNLCSASLLFVRQQALQKNIRLISDIATNLSPIMVDERRLRQLLINLLNNAVKFTPEGGLISLKVTKDDCFQAEDRRLEPSPRILFQVTDNGLGIAPKDLSQLFQPFVQIDNNLNRQQSGTGLGLAMVKQITELHGGRVAVESCPGKGSCFTVNLPYNRSSLTSLTSESANPIPTSITPVNINIDPAISPLILLAEDNEASISTFTAYLSARNYRLIVAKHGAEAVALAKTHQPDIILMDIQMPGMDGLEATRLIRADADLMTTPIIALTALAMPGDQERCITSGANQYLSKPVGLRQLVQVIQQLLEG